jgi:hypothetical protein
LKPWVPTAASLAHIFWTNQVRIHTYERYPHSSWISGNGASMIVERALAGRFDNEVVSVLKKGDKN